MSTHELKTEIEIDAERKRVWEILADFEAYPDWNPFIKFIRGALRKGGYLQVRLQPSGGKGMTLRPTVLVADSEGELRWIGHFLFPGLLDGEHRLWIEPISNGRVRFHQNEQFRGILVPLFRGYLDRGAQRGFVEMNAALKARAESQG